MKIYQKKKLINDVDKKYQERSKNDVPVKSSLAFWKISIMWFLIFGGFDLLFAGIGIAPYAGFIIDAMSNTYISIAFILYSSVMFGAIYNRYSKKVEVEKAFGMIPIAIITGVAVCFL